MYRSGTAYSYRELQGAMRQFATRTLGTFRDLFEGEYGQSITGTDFTVLGLKHSSTGAVYLFDFVSSTNFVASGGDAEHTILGQLVADFRFPREVDYDAVDEPDASIGQVVDGPFASGAIDISVSGGVVTVTDTYGELTTTVDGLFYGLRPGYGILFRDAADTDLWYYVKVNSVNLTGTVMEGVQVGAVNGGAVSADVISSYTGDRDKTRRVLFPIEKSVEPSQTPFGNITGSMWDSEVTLANAREGFFPRSGRHNFTNGVNYRFYGDNDPGSDYFHMVLWDAAASTPLFTHWWMGRVNGPSPALRRQNSSCGMFLGTSGPFTAYATGTDTYQYLFEAKDGTTCTQNPCILIAPIEDSNGAFQYSDPDVYTGASGYSHSFLPESLDSWVVTSAGDATLEAASQAAQIITTGTDPGIERNGLSVAAGTYGVVRFAIRKVQGGDSGSTGEVYFKTTGMPSYTGSDLVQFDESDLEREYGNWWVYRVDMAAAHAPGAGGTNNWTNTLLDLRIDFGSGGTNFGEQYEIGWIRVDDGDDTVSDAGFGAFEQYDGGFQAYGPTGASHDPTFGDTTTKDLDTRAYSIQAGLNGFQGGLTFGMENVKGRTFHFARPYGVEYTVPPTTRNFLNRFTPAYAILFEIPRTSVRNTRLGTPLSGTEIGRNAEYLSTDSYFMYVGTFPGVYRTVGLRATPIREVASGNRKFDEIAHLNSPLLGTDVLITTPTSNSGRAAYLYER